MIAVTGKLTDNQKEQNKSVRIQILACHGLCESGRLGYTLDGGPWCGIKENNPPCEKTKDLLS